VGREYPNRTCNQTPMTRHCSCRQRQYQGTRNKHCSARRHKSRRKGEGAIEGGQTRRPVREIKRLWKVEARVMPSVIDALGTIPRGLEENLRKLGKMIKVELIEKVALLGTARILRKVLEHG